MSTTALLRIIIDDQKQVEIKLSNQLQNVKNELLESYVKCAESASRLEHLNFINIELQSKIINMEHTLMWHQKCFEAQQIKEQEMNNQLTASCVTAAAEKLVTDAALMDQVMAASLAANATQLRYDEALENQVINFDLTASAAKVLADLALNDQEKAATRVADAVKLLSEEALKNQLMASGLKAATAKSLSDETLRNQANDASAAAHDIKIRHDEALESQFMASALTAAVMKNLSDIALVDLANAANATAGIVKLRFDEALKDQTKASDLAAASTKLLSDNRLLATQLEFERVQSQLIVETLRHAQIEQELLSEICGNVAHDLKTPLAALILCLDSLKNKIDVSNIPLTETYEQDLRTMTSACAFIQKAINKTTDYIKISKGVELIPSLHSLDVNEILTLVSNLITPVMRSDCTLKFQRLPENDTSMITTDKQWLIDNLLMLLSNAVKFGNNEIIVTVSLTDTNAIKFTVEDNGAGVAEEDISKLFNQFSRSQSKSVGGSGLSLFSLRNRMDALSGYDTDSCKYQETTNSGEDYICTTSSHCGYSHRCGGLKGSLFWFSLPYKPVVETPLQLSANLSLHTKPFRTLRILVVDDSALLVKILSKMIEREGHTVEVACNGSVGLEKMIANDKYDLVIMDVQMPIMGGLDAVKKFRVYESEHRPNKHLHIVCSSANCSEETFMSSGMDSSLPKPVKLVELISVLRLNM